MTSEENNLSARTPGFERNRFLEGHLEYLNSLLTHAEQAALGTVSAPQYPVILIMGPHRSGTTLLMQWLAQTGLFAYPTNLLSRFYAAPIIGAKIQLLLTDPRYSFRGELHDLATPTDFKSENGKTRGALAPNEFWYFWRRFLADSGRDCWADDELRKAMDSKTLLAELAGMMDVFQKPFAAKGMLFNYNIPFLDSLFDQILFIRMERNPIDNIASALEARRRQLGTESAWYSFKIPEYESLKNMDPVTQVTAQIQCINRAVTRGLSKVSEDRKLLVRYEELCREPAAIFNALTAKLKMIDRSYHGPAAFKISHSGTRKERASIQAALEYFERSTES